MESYGEWIFCQNNCVIVKFMGDIFCLTLMGCPVRLRVSCLGHYDDKDRNYRSHLYPFCVVWLEYSYWHKCCLLAAWRMPVAHSTSRQTSYRKISQSFKGARSVIKVFPSLWNLAGASKTIQAFKHPISRLRDIARSNDLCDTESVSKWLASFNPLGDVARLS